MNKFNRIFKELVARRTGFEPVTSAFGRRASTNNPGDQIGDGVAFDLLSNMTYKVVVVEGGECAAMP